MKKWKKLLGVTMCGAMVAGMSGCSSNTPKDNSYTIYI